MKKMLMKGEIMTMKTARTKQMTMLNHSVKRMRDSALRMSTVRTQPVSRAAKPARHRVA
jgi:hypothetical protein